MNKITIPREVNKWLQSLDLSYKMKNMKRDLSNGFLVAEILSRYFHDKLDMKSFSSGLSMEEKQSNWHYIKKLFGKFDQLQLKDDLIQKIINQAPNAGFEFLCILYKYLTKKDAVILNKVDETDQFKQYDPYLPKFMRPTAVNILRDHEIQRIPDNVTRIGKIEDTLKKHSEFLKQERQIFMKTKAFNALKSKKKKHRYQETSRIESRGGGRSSKSELEDQGDTSKMEVMNTTKNNEKKEEKVNLMSQLKEVGKTLNEYNVENEFKDIIKKNFIETDHNIELELKKFSDESEIIEFFFEKIHLCSDEKLAKIFTVFTDRQSKFIDIISIQLLEVVPFIKLITRFLDILIKNGTPLDTFLQSVLAICEGAKEKDILKCEIIFINFGLSIILDVIKAKPFYRSIMCQIIFALISNNKYSHFQVLQEIKKKFINSDELLFYHIIVKCMEFTNDDNFDEHIAEFYDIASAKGINSNCDIIKSKAIYLIILFMKYDPLNSLQYSNQIFKHTKTWNWEILSLILIYCSKTLMIYNTLKTEKNNMTNKDMDENLQRNMLDLEEKMNEIQKFEDTFLKIIDFIFQEKNPNMTLKVGFIYLSEILHYYPTLAEKYMKLLIEFKYNSVRKEVLEVNDFELEYTNNCFTEKYKVCGAPLMWNHIVVAGIFRDYVVSKLIRLEETHLNIFQSIVLNQEFQDQDAELWISFYNDMKDYLFISLCQNEFSAVALNICKKMFSFELILPQLLTSTFDIFISSMKLVYKNDVSDECHENMKSLLNYLSEIKTHNCKQYVYKLIKSFAINNNDIYMTSNLVELMNRIYQQERGDIFPEN
jgi:hypothetical protein